MAIVHIQLNWKNRISELFHQISKRFNVSCSCGYLIATFQECFCPNFAESPGGSGNKNCLSHNVLSFLFVDDTKLGSTYACGLILNPRLLIHFYVAASDS